MLNNCLYDVPILSMILRQINNIVYQLVLEIIRDPKTILRASTVILIVNND